MSLCVAQGNIPCRGEVCSREFDWNSMCEAMPFWKGQEMKRSYYSCITYVDFMVGLPNSNPNPKPSP